MQREKNSKKETYKTREKTKKKQKRKKKCGAQRTITLGLGGSPKELKEDGNLEVSQRGCRFGSFPFRKRKRATRKSPKYPLNKEDPVLKQMAFAQKEPCGPRPRGCVRWTQWVPFGMQTVSSCPPNFQVVCKLLLFILRVFLQATCWAAWITKCGQHRNRVQ